MLLSSFEVNRMKAIAMAIKEGADAQHENHSKQIERLEAEVAMLKSERALLRKRVEAVDTQSLGKKHSVKTDRTARNEICEGEEVDSSSDGGTESEGGERKSTKTGIAMSDKEIVLQQQVTHLQAGLAQVSQPPLLLLTSHNDHNHI